MPDDSAMTGSRSGRILQKPFARPSSPLIGFILWEKFLKVALIRNKVKSTGPESGQEREKGQRWHLGHELEDSKVFCRGRLS
ncbi:hypothetical protein HHI36_023988 [Cryptolaemus montrouzieri]|uniref:Uncharacterized protein n=1 Tax=Cryptolaemus montrouzieri TaxID=559131 RepID=A0ABD2P376_9CUCU